MLHGNFDDPISAILESPSAPVLVARLQTQLEKEQQRRQNFYADYNDDVKVEFINGEVVVHSPVKKEHTEAGKFLLEIADIFTRLAKLGFVGYEKMLSTFTRNDYEPDIVFFGNAKADHFKNGQWKFPPPDFAAEVLSDSTEKNDRGIKFEDYAAHGVQEYWLIDPDEACVEQYFLGDDGKFHLHLKAREGRIHSRVIEGFSIEIRAIFDEQANTAALLEILQKFQGQG